MFPLVYPIPLFLVKRFLRVYFLKQQVREFLSRLVYNGIPEGMKSCLSMDALLELTVSNKASVAVRKYLCW